MGGSATFEAISGLNAAIDLVKALVASGSAIDKAELKLKLADTLSALADAKMAVTNAEEHLRFADQENRELREALSAKGETVRVGDALYYVDEAGKAKGDPFCLACWESTHRLRSLIRGDRGDPFHHCTACSSKFARAQALFAIEMPRV